MMPIVNETTENTVLAIDGNLFIPCQNYSISITPYQILSSGMEDGIPMQLSKEYPGGKFIICV